MHQLIETESIANHLPTGWKHGCVQLQTMKRFRGYCTVIKFNMFKSWWTESTICISATTFQVKNLGPPWRKAGDIVKIFTHNWLHKKEFLRRMISIKDREVALNPCIAHTLSGELSAPIIRDWIISKGLKVFKTKEKTSTNPRTAFGQDSGEMLIKCHVVSLLCIISIKLWPLCIQTWHQDRYK